MDSKEVKVPLLGKVKTEYIIVGIGAVGVGLWFYFRHEQNAAGSSTALSVPDTSQSIDPATGEPYGSSADLSALDNGSGGFAEAGGFGNSDIDPSTGFIAGSPQDAQALQQMFGTGTTTTTATPTSDAQWASNVQSTLEAIGYNGETVAIAVGLFLARQPLDANQVTIMQVALAEVGNPPVGTYTIKKKTGTTPAPVKHPSSGTGGIKHTITSGQESLNTFANQTKNTPADIVFGTGTHHKIQPRWEAYVKKNNFNAKMPAGITLYFKG